MIRTPGQPKKVLNKGMPVGMGAEQFDQGLSYSTLYQNNGRTFAKAIKGDGIFENSDW